MSDVDKAADTTGSLIAASKVNGTSVYDHAGEKLGSIYDVMINKSSGKTAYAIMSFGGFLGMGNSYHPIPWQNLTYDEQKGGYVVDIDPTRLEGAPSYAVGETTAWTDPAFGPRVDDYYGARI
jgi:sporulation protein YlmC with PRC-barrel domain